MFRSNDHETVEDESPTHFHDSEDELSFTISSDTKQVDANDQDEENSDPGVVVDAAMIPEFDGESSGDDFQW